MGRGLAEDRDAIAREGKILRGIEGESDRQPCKAAMEDQQQQWHGPAWKPTDQHQQGQQEQRKIRQQEPGLRQHQTKREERPACRQNPIRPPRLITWQRSEEHTSELQSLIRTPSSAY